MNMFVVLGAVLGGAVGLNVCSALTQRATTYLTLVRSLDRTQRTPRRPVSSGTSPPPPAADQPQRARWWWEQLLTPKGILGGVLVPIEGLILVLNSYLIAVSLEVILSYPGQPLLLLHLWGWERDVTMFDLYGLLISLSQMIAASAYHTAATGHHPLLRRSAMVALCSLVGFELGAAALRGATLGGVLNAILSGLFALGIAAVEVVVGILVIDGFLIPLLLSIIWTALAPLWLIADWLQRRPARPAAARVVRAGSPLVRLLAEPFAILDAGLMHPLRCLDAQVARLLAQASRLSHHQHTQPQHEGSRHGKKTVPLYIR